MQKYVKLSLRTIHLISCRVTQDLCYELLTLDSSQFLYLLSFQLHKYFINPHWILDGDLVDIETNPLSVDADYLFVTRNRGRDSHSFTRVIKVLISEVSDEWDLIRAVFICNLPGGVKRDDPAGIPERGKEPIQNLWSRERSFPTVPSILFYLSLRSDKIFHFTWLTLPCSSRYFRLYDKTFQRELGSSAFRVVFVFSCCIHFFLPHIAGFK